MINAAQAPIHESGLPELLQRTFGPAPACNHGLGRRRCATRDDLHRGRHAGVRWPDRPQVRRGAAAEIGAALRAQDRLPHGGRQEHRDPGTTDGVVRAALESASGKTAGRGFGLGMNPEFLTEGTAVADFSHPDRIVLGGIDARTHDALRELYAGFDAAMPRIATNTRPRR